MTNRVIDVDVLFYENMRGSPPYGDCYRPHFVVDNSDGCYLGIQFVALKESPFGERIVCKAELSYDKVDYSPLIQNARFLIKEGSKTVGEGVVLYNPSV